MKTTDFDSDLASEDSAVRPLDEIKETATHAVESSEMWVRENPIPAILTALGGGLLIGLLAGWSLSESRHEDYRATCRRLAREWQERLHLD